mgnify:CR=1 FL=1
MEKYHRSRIDEKSLCADYLLVCMQATVLVAQ